MAALSAYAKEFFSTAMCDQAAANEFTTAIGLTADVTAGTVTASKAVVAGASKEITSLTQLVMGHTAALTTSNGDGATNLVPNLQHIGTTKATGSALLAVFNTTNDATVAPSLNFLKSGNAAIGSNTIVAANEVLGEITFFGDDGVDYESPAARIHALALATPGTGDMPGALVFSCTTDAGETLAELGRFTVAAGLTLGVAGTSLGKLTLSGNTAGVVTINTAATAGDWVLTLPADDGDSGEQLQTNGSGVATWEAAGSLRAVKKIVADVSGEAEKMLDKLCQTPVYAFQYIEGARPTTGDFATTYVGVMGDDLPEILHHGGRIFNPISAYGTAVLAIKALAARVEALEGHKKPKK